MNIWYIVKSRISKVGSREDGLIELGRSENWGRDGAQSKGKCRRVKTKKQVREGGINISDVEFNQLVSTRPGLKGHRKMKMGIFQHTCTIECTCQITCPGVEGKFCRAYTFAFYCCRVILIAWCRYLQFPCLIYYVNCSYSFFILEEISFGVRKRGKETIQISTLISPCGRLSCHLAWDLNVSTWKPDRSAAPAVPSW